MIQNEQRPVAVLGDLRGVDHRAGGRRIDHHHVEFLAHVIHHVGEVLGGQQGQRRLDELPGGKQVQARQIGLIDRVRQLALSGEIMGQPLVHVFDPVLADQDGLAQIGVDQKHGFSPGGHAAGDPQRQIRLSAAGVVARHGDPLDLLSRESDVGAYGVDGFVPGEIQRQILYDPRRMRRLVRFLAMARS